jgi:ribonuclease D
MIAGKGDQADVAALRGWRRELFGLPALRLIQGEIALRFVNRRVDLVEIGVEP